MLFRSLSLVLSKKVSNVVLMMKKHSNEELVMTRKMMKISRALQNVGLVIVLFLKVMLK